MSAHSVTTGRLTGCLAVVVAMLLTVACGSTGSSIPVNQASAPVHAGDYQIGPGDSLQVFVWRNPDVSANVPVRPDGKISTPLVEDMVAVGKTPTQLARDIETVLAEFIRNPSVTVIVDGFVGTFGDQIRVVGAAAQPRALPYRNQMTLLDAMIEVGGLAPQAAGNRAKLVRWVDQRQQEIPVRIHDLINKGRIDANVMLRPGDVLIIPESIF